MIIIIVAAKAIEDDKVSPDVGWIVFFSLRMDSFKEVIIDNMELRSYGTSSEIADDTDQGGVMRGSAHVLAPARARAPFGNLVTPTKCGIEHICRASPGVSMEEGMVIRASRGEYLFRRESGRPLRSGIVEVHRMRQSKGP